MFIFKNMISTTILDFDFIYNQLLNVLSIIKNK